jgi:molybdopterin-guanine dinucleotide biosynthesis protein B
VSLIKHAHHNFDVDQPGKDSHRHREAGATEVLVSSNARWALMHELRGAPELSLRDAIARLSPCDIVLVEGFKTAPIPKLEVHRPVVGKPLLYPGDPHVVAFATDQPGSFAGLALPVLSLDDLDALATLVIAKARPAHDAV